MDAMSTSLGTKMSDVEMKNEEQQEKPFITEDVLTEEQVKETLDFMESEFTESESEREEYLQDVDKWRAQYDAVPAEKRKSFPWDGASNIVTGITKTSVNGIASNMKATFSQKHPFFHIEAKEENLKKQGESLSKFLDILVESKFHLNLREISNSIIDDLVLIGTEFVYVPWLEDTMKFKRKDESGVLQTISVSRHKGPAVIPLRVEDFYARDYVHDIQNAPWVAIKHNLMWHELKQRENQGFYQNVDKIKDFYNSSLEENLERVAERQGFSSSEARIYEIFEVYRFMDIDNGIDYADCREQYQMDND